MNKWITALSLVSAATAGVAAAQDAPGGAARGGMLRRADANGDGVVTRAEYQAFVEQRFARQDANGNGVLDPEERPMRGHMGADAPPPPAAGTTPPHDPVTRARYEALATARFDRLDANHDGKLDGSELANAMPARGATPSQP